MGKFYVIMGEISGGSANDSIAIWDTTTSLWSYRDGKPIRTNNLSGSVSASITYCNNRPGVKIWCAGGSIQGQTTRPLDVYADTCLLNCTNPLTGINLNSNVTGFKLSQNYPNPFNPVTNISYDIPHSGWVKITISDILGKEAVILENEFKSAGKFELSFDGTEFASGVYFYRLEVNDASTLLFSEVKKMLLIK
ncbi:MAG: T9SS type A sorting domain-containing protein [Ignavibacteria bacterium]|nr:T9SS type A sorting domain-containing protein [Ignavibacteria bacterium]